MRAGIAAAGLSISRPLVVLGLGAIALLAAGIWGWATYGAAVFFEMIASGIASCL
jgi:hypothetical protein